MKPYLLYLFFLLFVWVGCTRADLSTICVSFSLLPESNSPTRANDPDEDRIADYNLFIFNAYGLLEEKVYVSSRQLETEDGVVTHHTRLMQNVPYTILAAANLGYELPCRTLAEAKAYRYHMAYPDEFTPGIPMAVVLDNVRVGEDGHFSLPLKRLMARVDLRIDRTGLDPDVQFTVRSIQIGGCPSSVQLFNVQSKAESREHIFREGFVKSWREVDALNREVSLGMSGTCPFYLLENCQGDLLESVTTDQGKVFQNSLYQEVCSYIEIKADYRSPLWNSRSDSFLIYRFYLGENLNNFDVVRNACYQVTVRPEGDGLREDSWRVDKSGLEPAEKAFILHPAAYNECRSGEDFHLWCEVRPAGTPMTIDPLAHATDPRVQEVYDYTVDDDGYGLTLHTRKGGSAVVYFKAGPPVNRDTLALVVVDP